MQLDFKEAEHFFDKAFGGLHHLPSEIARFGLGWKVDFIGDVATHDSGFMTKLVILGHDMCLRVSIQDGNHGLCLAVHKRAREGDFSERHPFLEDAIFQLRQVTLTTDEIFHSPNRAIVDREVLEKAKKWDALDERISAFYAEDESLTDDQAEGSLVEIGEAAAEAFGYIN